MVASLRTQVVRIAGTVIFLSCATIAAYFGLLVRDRTLPISRATIKVLNTEPVMRGSELQIDAGINYTHACNAHISRVLIDSTGAKFSLQTFNIYDNQPGLVHFVSYITIPLSFAPGPAVYESNPQYVCNFFQQLFPLTIPQPRRIKFDVGEGIVPQKQQSGHNSVDTGFLMHSALAGSVYNRQAYANDGVRACRLTMNGECACETTINEEP